MRREGCCEDDLSPEDFLCDFCQQCWAEDRPMVEGHQGACVCGVCLRVAYMAVVHEGMNDAVAGVMCSMCRETDRDEPYWQSPVVDGVLICQRCIKQSAGILSKDEEYNWQKPVKKG